MPSVTAATSFEKTATFSSNNNRKTRKIPAVEVKWLERIGEFEDNSIVNKNFNVFWVNCTIWADKVFVAFFLHF